MRRRVDDCFMTVESEADIADTYVLQDNSLTVESRVGPIDASTRGRVDAWPRRRVGNLIAIIMSSYLLGCFIEVNILYYVRKHWKMPKNMQ